MAAHTGRGGVCARPTGSTAFMTSLVLAPCHQRSDVLCTAAVARTDALVSKLPLRPGFSMAMYAGCPSWRSNAVGPTCLGPQHLCPTLTKQAAAAASSSTPCSCGCAGFRPAAGVIASTSARFAAAPGRQVAAAACDLPGSGQVDTCALPAAAAEARYVMSSTGPQLRTGHRNAHPTKKRNTGTQASKGPLHSGLAYGSGGTGSAGGLSFRSGAGQMSFKGPSHAPFTAALAAQAAAAAIGSTCFRPADSRGCGGCATFRPAAAASSGSGGSNGGPQAGYVSQSQQWLDLSSYLLDSRALPPTVAPASSLDGAAQPQLRSGYSNGHHTGKRKIGAKASKGPSHSSHACGSGGTGSAGGLSFRSGAGQLSFRAPHHTPPAISQPQQGGGIGCASFRPGHGCCASFRPAAAAAGATSTALDQQASQVQAITGDGHHQGANPPTDQRPDVTFDGGQQSTDARQAMAPTSDNAARQAPTANKAMQDTSKLGRLVAQLQALGLAGVVAYGLLNTLWYTVTFMTVWLLTKVPRGQGAGAATQSFVAVMAIVWAGSQVTKVARAAGALVLAPFVDKALDWLQGRLRLASKRQAFLVVLGCCITLALALFSAVVLVWA